MVWEVLLEAACRVFKEFDGGGQTIGILSSFQHDSANSYVDIIIPSGTYAVNNIIPIMLYNHLCCVKVNILSPHTLWAYNSVGFSAQQPHSMVFRPNTLEDEGF